MPPTTLEITIQRRSGAEAPVTAVFRAPSVLPVQRSGLLQLDDDTLLHLGTLLLDPLAYGTCLGQALFHGAIRDLFMQSRTVAPGSLRVLLIVEDPGLKALHWQRLCAPLRAGGAGWDFLALDQQEPFSLYLPSQTDRRYLPFGRRDLRALVVVAAPPADNPYRLASFDAPETVTRVVTALGDIPCDVLAAVPGAVGLPTLDELMMRLTGHPYTLLHVVAHGQFGVRTGESIVCLLGADGAVDPIPAERLLRRLDRVQGVRGLPHLAFLATCQSADPRAEAVGALGGLAQRLVRDLGMPAVVAMTERVTIDTAAVLATRFYTHLRTHGEVDRALAEACAGLAERGDITVPALYSRLGGLPLFSDSLDRDLTAAEVSFGLQQLRALLPDRAPVLLDTFETGAARLTQLQNSGQDFLGGTGKAEHDEALAGLNRLAEEVLETLSFNALALGKPPPPYDDRCPFRGLQVFRAEDRAFFFGRETWVAQLNGRLVDHPFLAVLGPSGAGKSSLVLAGLAPAWRDRTPGGQVAVMTPGRDPLGQLAAVLASRGGESRLLVVDQFEELFTLVSDDSQRRRFVEQLLARAAQQPVVVTMRAEFWGDCAPYPQLREVMQAHQALIAPMTPDELRSAMEQQAGVVGLRFEADLSQTLLDDVTGEPGAMPLLQHALLELWKRRHGRWLRTAEYRALGGVSQAIAGTAEAVYMALTPAERQQVRGIFLRLVRLDDQDVQRDTRRRVALDELVTQDSDRASVVRLVTRLADEKLIVTQTNPASGSDEVELAHEALITHWPRLREWRDQDRAQLQVQQVLGQAARDWAQTGQDESLLVHRGRRLDDAMALSRHSLNALEIAYLDTCANLRAREAAEVERRRQLEVTLAQERAAQAEATAQAQAHRARRFRRLALALGFVAMIPLLLTFKAIQRNGSPWQPLTGVPGNPVFTLAAAPGTAQPPATEGLGSVPFARYCAGTSDIGVLCSRTGERWNLFQEGLPIGQPTPFGAGPFAGDVRGVSPLVFDQGDAHHLTAAVTDEGLFASSDGGLSWRAINTTLMRAPLSALAVMGDLVLAAVSPAERNDLYVSQDGGATWVQVNVAGSGLPAAVYSILIAPSGDVVYAGGSDGLYRTTMGAWDRWTQVVATGDKVEVLAAVPGANGGVYLAVVTDSGGQVMQFVPGAAAPTQVLARFNKLPMALAPDPDPAADPPLYVLLNQLALTYEVVGVQRSGDVQSYGGRPGWGPFTPAYDLLVVRPPNTARPQLWLGHNDGLLCYACR